MERRYAFIVSVFLVFSLALSGIVSAQRVIDLDKVGGDMRVLGRDIGDWTGNTVAYGDVNGDGFMDIIISAPEADLEYPARDDAGNPMSSLALATHSQLST